MSDTEILYAVTQKSTDYDVDRVAAKMLDECDLILVTQTQEAADNLHDSIESLDFELAETYQASLNLLFREIVSQSEYLSEIDGRDHMRTRRSLRGVFHRDIKGYITQARNRQRQDHLQMRTPQHIGN